MATKPLARSYTIVVAHVADLWARGNDQGGQAAGWEVTRCADLMTPVSFMPQYALAPTNILTA